MADKEFLERMLSMLPEENFKIFTMIRFPRQRRYARRWGKSFFRKVLFLRYADV